ncbi:hypothetical protein INT44_008121 [Umbelopsis vinacea]|uniref:F-box domain-containing protein n=1 Tax=Umbelopsis vinacea TaxID=44442 RepID=A0A8H7UFP5_9FUNG|nr:hypothetical protein INT44_008121 [Umbelopsis vinacea]
MSLPTEILQDIISQLDQATLANCTRVSSQFRALAIPVLYESPSLLTADRFRRFSKDLSADNAVYVHTLDLSMTARRWDSIKGQEIVELLLKCLYITHLDLDMCMALRNTDIETIMNAIGKNLHFLSLCSCSYLNTASIVSVATYCTNLRVINISGICTVDDPVVDLASKNPHLETVNLADCNHITEKSVKAVMKCPKLKYLNIEGCHDVLDFESESESAIPQPEWETEEEEFDDEEEVDYDTDIMTDSDYNYDSVNTVEDEEDYSGYSSDEQSEHIASETMGGMDGDGDNVTHTA